jgi:hypothetical protein
MRKLLLILVAGLSVLGIGVAISSALESKDVWSPAGAQFKADSKDSVFTVGTGAEKIEDHCFLFQVKGRTPGKQGKFADQQKIGIGVPTFTNCTIGGTTANETNGEWKLELHSQGMTAAQEKECEESSEGQFNRATEDDDCVTITIPKAGAKVEVPGVCTITIAPVAPFSLTDYYDDELGIIKDQQPAIPISTTGSFCPNATTAQFKASFGVNPIITDDE